jgi:hypothetical protein
MALMSNILIYKLWENKLPAAGIVLVNKSNVRLGIKRETEEGE